uniref:Uncharacterized protein n=1 Tax=Arundo donax TaxID=35708 RepID=A0A0A9G487_ARUDO
MNHYWMVKNRSGAILFLASGRDNPNSYFNFRSFTPSIICKVLAKVILR